MLNYGMVSNTFAGPDPRGVQLMSQKCLTFRTPISIGAATFPRAVGCHVWTQLAGVVRHCHVRWWIQDVGVSCYDLDQWSRWGDRFRFFSPPQISGIMMIQIITILCVFLVIVTTIWGMIYWRTVPRMKHEITWMDISVYWHIGCFLSFGRIMAQQR
jgi:hypothetical protein